MPTFVDDISNEHRALMAACMKSNTRRKYLLMWIYYPDDDISQTTDTLMYTVSQMYNLYTVSQSV